MTTLHIYLDNFHVGNAEVTMAEADTVDTPEVVAQVNQQFEAGTWNRIEQVS